MSYDKDFINKLLQVIKSQAEYYGVSYRADYSGRGMYGRSCVSISGSRMDCMVVIGEVIKDMSDSVPKDEFSDVVDIMLDYSNDSMGLGIVLYWPYISEPTPAEA